MGGIGVAKQAGAGVVIGIEERHEAVRLGQVFLGQLVEVVQDPIGRQAAKHLSPQHAAQERHQQASGHPFAHHVAHHQGPAPLLAAPAQELGAGGDEVVVVAAHLEGGPAAGRQLHPLDHGTVIRQELGLDFRTGGELPIHAFVAARFLQQLFTFDRHTGEIGHQLHVAAVAIAPVQAAARTHHVEPPAAATASHHRGGE